MKDYRIENVLPIVADLADKYTSRESSSVGYKRAEKLMEAVIYCLKEGEEGSRCGVLAPHIPEERILYEQGAKQVKENVYEAKAVYEELLPWFEDYGCMNYRDTILKGIPEFFIRYDPVFAPMDHLLTLDYPLLCGKPMLQGARLILEYLRAVRLEALFLKCFHPLSVCNLLRSILPDYEELYLDNICEPVLFRAAVCLIAGRLRGVGSERMEEAEQGTEEAEQGTEEAEQGTEEAEQGSEWRRRVKSLELTDEDVYRIRLFFEGKSKEEIASYMESAIGMATGCVPDAKRYFLRAARGYGTLIQNGIRENCLEVVFHING